MHQHRTLAQVILILSIVNFVLAAPAVREIVHDARGDVVVPVLPEEADVESVSEIPSYSVTLGGNLAYKNPRADENPSSEEFSEPATLLKSRIVTPEPLPPTPPPRKIPRPIIMTPEKKKATVIVAGIGLLTAAILGLVEINLVAGDNSTAT